MLAHASQEYRSPRSQEQESQQGLGQEPVEESPQQEMLPEQQLKFNQTACRSISSHSTYFKTTVRQRSCCT